MYPSDGRTSDASSEKYVVVLSRERRCARRVSSCNSDSDGNWWRALGDLVGPKKPPGEQNETRDHRENCEISRTALIGDVHDKRIVVLHRDVL
jgi:hypothetical protein